MNDLEQNLKKLDLVIQKHEEVFNLILSNQRSKYKELPDEIFIIMMLFRKTTERLDSIFILIENKSENAAKSISRDLFENVLYFSYVTDEIKRYKFRALSYYYSALVDQINLAKQILKNGKEGNKIRKYLRVTKDNSEIIQKAKMAQNHFTKEIETDEYNNIKIEWERFKKKEGTDHPKWYSLMKGPKSLKKLANHCKYDEEYALLYGIYSRETHSLNVMNQFESVNGLAAIKNLRVYDNPLLELMVSLKLGIETLKRLIYFFDMNNEININKWVKYNIL